MNGRVPVEPGEGVECLICGDYMRSLPPHLTRHGITSKEYRQRFPDAPLAGEVHIEIHRDLQIDRVARGEDTPRMEFCPRGHRMTARNTIVNKERGKRQCRTCQRASVQQEKVKERARQRAKDWYYANRERVLEKRKEAYWRERAS